MRINKDIARIAGVLVGVLGGFVSPRVAVAGDATATRGSASI